MLTTPDTHESLASLSRLEDIQVLVVDNDCDNRGLYTALLEHQGAKVTAAASIQSALDFLDEHPPNLLICELTFLGESVLPLIQRVRALAFRSGRLIPILVISTCNPVSLAQRLTGNIEAHLLKPVDIDDFVNQVWKLVALSHIVSPFGTQAWMVNQNSVKQLCCGRGAN